MKHFIILNLIGVCLFCVVGINNKVARAEHKYHAACEEAHEIRYEHKKR